MPSAWDPLRRADGAPPLDAPPVDPQLATRITRANKAIIREMIGSFFIGVESGFRLILEVETEDGAQLEIWFAAVVGHLPKPTR